MVQRIKLGELLVRAGVLDESRLQAALQEQERWGGRLGATLVAMGFVSEDLLVKALSKQLSIPIARLESPDVPSWVLERIDRGYAESHGLCPERLQADRTTLLVAMSDPLNVPLIEELARRSGLRILVSVASERTVQRGIVQLFGAELPSSGSVSGGGAAQPFARTSYAGPRTSEDARPTVGGPPPGPPAPSAPIGVAAGGPPTALAGELDNLREVVRALEASQQRQWTAIRVLSDLLMERGLIPRDELAARIGRRSP